jgi:hypothetical protein
VRHAQTRSAPKRNASSLDVAVCHSLLQTKLVIVGLDPTIQ